MMKKIIIFFVAIVILAGGVFAYLRINQEPVAEESSIEEVLDNGYVTKNKSVVYSNCPTETEEKAFKPKFDEPMKPKQEITPAEGGGPASHNIYRLTSSDQVNFFAENKLLLSGSSVPETVKTADGRELVYFVAGTANSHGMRVAEKQADGSLGVLNCVTFDNAFDIAAVDPNVLLLPDGRLRMTYLSNFNEAEKDRAINSAVSTDGINFTVESVLLSGPNYSDPTETLLNDGSFLLAVPVIGDYLDFYISSDGKNFQKQSSLKNDGGAFGDLVTMSDGSVRLYVGSDILRMYESQDGGKTWKKGVVTVLEQDSDQFGFGMPSVLYDGLEMEIYYISSKGKTK